MYLYFYLSDGCVHLWLYFKKEENNPNFQVAISLSDAAHVRIDLD